MPTYGTDEVAEVVFQRLRRAGIHVASVAVTALDTSRTWVIRARFEPGNTLTRAYPFAAPDGIHTPAELADWFVSEVEGGRAG